MYRYEIIYVFKPPFVKHKMLLLPNGEVIHNYPVRGIQREPLASAAKGRESIHSSYVNSFMSPDQLCNKAWKMSQNRQYRLNYNCEHFLNDLLGKPIESPQLRFALLAGIAAIGVMALARNA